MPHQEELAKVQSKLQVPFHRAAYGEEEATAVAEVVRSGWLTMGPKTFEFERQFAEYVGAKHAIAVSSGTAALHLALAAVGIGSQDEVLVPTNTFTATAEVVTYFGARPVLMDTCSETMNLDPEDAARRITPRTRAILAVHFAGQPCELDALARLASAHGLALIEDAAHALPARYAGQTIGSISPLTAFSFYATKTLATGEGGMVTTSNAAFAERIRLLRLHGISRDAWNRYSGDGHWRYEVEEAGYKYNLTDLQAALGLVQLAKCDAHREARCRIAERYSAAFAGVPGLEAPRVLPGRTSAWHLYVLRLCPAQLSIGRDRFIEILRERGIGASVHFIPLHLHPFYRSAFGYRPGDFPRAEKEFERCLSLPLFPHMTVQEVERVIETVSDIAHERALQSWRVTHAVTQEPGRAGEITLHAPIEAHPGTRPLLPRSSPRWFDFLAAAGGLLFLAPLLAAIAAAIKLSDGEFVLFRQTRIGRNLRPFRVCKFRTMVPGAERFGAAITAGQDSRVTHLGKFLRQSKLDELPQLWNVLRGEMALVGPRPEVPRYVEQFRSSYEWLLRVRPGMTDPASLAFFREEEHLTGTELESRYASAILPRKLALSSGYLSRRTWASDFVLILRTLARVVLPGSAALSAEDRPVLPAATPSLPRRIP